MSLAQAQQQLAHAQAAVKAGQAAYVRALACAAVLCGAAAAAGVEAGAEAAAGAGALQALQVQAATAQQALQSRRHEYGRAAEAVQQAQAAANAAAAAMLRVAESVADSAHAPGGLAAVPEGHAMAMTGAGAPRHSNRRKAALNRKRFLGKQGPAAWRWGRLPGLLLPGGAAAVGGRARRCRPALTLPFDLPPACRGGGGGGGGAAHAAAQRSGPAAQCTGRHAEPAAQQGPAQRAGRRAGGAGDVSRGALRGRGRPHRLGRQWQQAAQGRRTEAAA